MSTHNIGFYEDLTKIIFDLSSNTHLISSAEHGPMIKTFVCLFKALRPGQQFFSHFGTASWV